MAAGTLCLLGNALPALAASPGTPDSTFGGFGLAVVTPAGAGSIATAVTTQANGSVIEAGSSSFSGRDTLTVARLTPTGSPDSTFNGGAIARAFLGSNQTSRANAVAVEPAGLAQAGDIVAAGYYTPGTPGAVQVPALVRFTSTGALDSSFAPGSSTGSGTTTISTTALPSLAGGFTGVAVYPAGSAYAGDIVAAGNVIPTSGTNAGQQELVLARYLPSGALDSAFGTGGIVTEYFARVGASGQDQIAGMAIDAAGNIDVVGQAPASFVNGCINGSGVGLLVARFLAANGAPDTAGFDAAGTFGPAGSYILGSGSSNMGCPFGYEGSGLALESTPSAGQDLVVSGTEVVTPAVANGNYTYQPLAARFTAAGVPDTSFGGGATVFTENLDGGANAVAVVPDATGTQPMGLGIVLTGYQLPAAGGAGDTTFALRLHTDGTADTTFGTSGVETLACGLTKIECGNGLAVQADSKLLVAVSGGGTSSTPEMAVWRLLQTTVSIADAAPITVGAVPGPLQYAVFPVTLNAPSPVPVTVGFTTVNGSAVSPGDYTATGGTVTFNPGQTSQNIFVPVDNSGNHQGLDVSFSVVLTGQVQNVAVSTASASVLLHHIGYRMVGSDGGIFDFNSPFYGSEGGKPLNQPIIGMASDHATLGYWEVAADGGIFSFNAPFLGSEGGQPLNAPIVGMAATPSGQGYWLVAADGGIFTFGDAPFLGSEGGKPLNAPIVGMAATPSGQGYWLVAADGGIFTFGDAPFLGSMGGKSLNRAMVGMAPTTSGQGYWMVAGDGGIFTFGDAQFYGSMGGTPLNKPVVGITTDVNTGGYWMVASDGGIFSFNAPFLGSEGGQPLNAPIVAMAAS